MKDLIKRLMANDFASLEVDVEDMAAKKIVSVIREKKEKVVADLNKAKKRGTADE